MTRREEYESKTEQLLMPIITENNYELVDVEYVKEVGNYYLRVFLDKEGGITINDLEAVSRKLSELLDEKDFIMESYILEVSSPGLGRQLKKDKDFKRSLGEEVEIKLFRAIDKQKEFVGFLKSYDDTTIVISDEKDTEITLDRSNIANIRLTVHF